MKRGVAISLGAAALAATGATATRTGPAAATAAPSAAAPTTTSVPTPPAAGSLPEPASEAVDPVRTLVPRIAAIPVVLQDDDDFVAAIGEALADPASAIAVEDSPGTLCAVVPVVAPLMARGRWERNGEPLASSPESRRDPPGYGDCVPNDDGEPFDDGVYQYVAVGSTGARSAAATVVIGSATIVVWLLNTGDEPVCLVHMSPTRADFYEALSTPSPLQPGEAMAVRVANVDQDVQVFGCPPDGVLRTMRVSPEPRTYVPLFDAADHQVLTPPSPAGGGATGPTTTTPAPQPTSTPRPTTVAPGATTTT